MTRWAAIVWTAMLGLNTLPDSPAHAAKVTVEKGLADTVTFITLKGDIGVGDAASFEQAVQGLSSGIVYLQSDGGQIGEALSIAWFIRKHNLTTVVPPSKVCTSACGIIWLAGQKRFVGKDGRVGFHAAYELRGQHPRESGAANALIGAYFNQLGLGPDAIWFLTEKSPRAMQWLTEPDAKRLGIDVEFGTVPQEVRLHALERSGEYKHRTVAVPIPRPKPLEVLMRSAIQLPEQDNATSNKQANKDQSRLPPDPDWPQDTAEASSGNEDLVNREAKTGPTIASGCKVFLDRVVGDTTVDVPNRPLRAACSEVSDPFVLEGKSDYALP
ncbi:MAG: hypothetical protein ACKVP5_07745 [Aestuariivirga sp.]